MTISLQVSDLIITPRTVEVPDNCPSCGRDLRAHEALKHVEYQAYERLATIGDFEIDWGDDEPRLSEGDLACSWECAHCGYELAVANEERIEE